MPRDASAPRKTSKKTARGSAPKPASQSQVVISRPTSPKRTEKTFDVGARRSKDIEALVEEAVG